MNTPESKGAVLVTGASSGIGKATVLKLDQQGFQVYGSVRNQADAAALRSEGSERCTPVIMDVTEPESIAGVRDQIQEQVGSKGLDGLVNNAAIGIGDPWSIFQ